MSQLPGAHERAGPDGGQARQVQQMQGAGDRPRPRGRRIITVPTPKLSRRTRWRDTAPNLPSGARRDTEPAPEGAWDTTRTTGPSHETLKKAGVIEDKHKPLTLMQRLRPWLLV